MTTKTIELPPPGFPMLTRMISNPLFPASSSTAPTVVSLPNGAPPVQIQVQTSEGEPVSWVVGQKHPLVSEMRVVRMFIDRGGVEIYSVSSDGMNGMRNHIPMSGIRLIEEVMPIEEFVEELTAAEAGDPDDDDDDDNDPEPTEQIDTATTGASAANGQATA